jgi:hypothetical protein
MPQLFYRSICVVLTLCSPFGVNIKLLKALGRCIAFPLGKVAERGMAEPRSDEVSRRRRRFKNKVTLILKRTLRVLHLIRLFADAEITPRLRFGAAMPFDYASLCSE